MANIYRNIGAAASDTGGLWHQLDAQMSAQGVSAPAAEGGGLWSMIVLASVGGMWDEIDNETLMLRTEDIKTPRIDIWDASTEETLILPREGTLPLWVAVLAKTNADGQIDADGTMLMRRADRMDVWDEVESETLIMARPVESVFMQQVRQRDLSNFYPRQIQGYALKKLTDTHGETYWILKNLRTDAYLRLTEEQVYLWDQMDGKSSVQDIAVGYMLTYGKLAINSLLLLLDQLQQKGFIEPLVDVYGAIGQSLAQKRQNVLWRRALRALINTEISIGGIDNLITRTYKGGRILFNPIIQWLMLAVIVAGGTAFLALVTGIVPRDASVIGGAGAIIGVITLYALQFITLMIHEWSHAIATKHYGREVRRGGFLIYLGMPAAFVDTTDIWMEPRRPRIVVSWAGPHSGFFLGGLASLLLLVAPGDFLQGVLYQFAFLTYLTSIMNLNPLLKLDGYYILMDWLEIPRLREKSLAFIGPPMRKKLRKREPLTRDEKIFAVFGVLAFVWTAFTLLMLLATIGKYLLQFAQTIPGMIMIALLVLWFLYRRITRRLRKWRLVRQKKKAASAGAA